MKQKSAVIGALVITLIFCLAMGAVGVNAITNQNSVPLNNSIPSPIATPAIISGSGTAQDLALVQPLQNLINPY